MGKGDIKTRRGKLFSGSYGKRRPRKKKKTATPPASSNISESVKQTGKGIEPKKKAEEKTTPPESPPKSPPKPTSETPKKENVKKDQEGEKDTGAKGNKEEKK